MLPVDTLIITPLLSEQDAVLNHLTRFGEIEHIIADAHPITYHTVTIGKHRVAVAKPLQMGNTDSARIAAQALDDVNPRNVIVVGIAAGIEGAVNLGDIIIPDKIFYSEYGKLLSSGLTIRLDVEGIDTALYNLAQQHTRTPWPEGILEKWPKGEISAEQSFPYAHFYPIACGEKVIQSTEDVKGLIALTHPKLVGIEMESYGVAKAVNSHQPKPRLLVIRGVCDFANEAKNDLWHSYAADAAATFAVDFVVNQLASEAGQEGRRFRSAHQVDQQISIKCQSLKPVSSAVFRSEIETLRGATISQEIVVDQTDLFVDNVLQSPEQLIERQKDLAQQVKESCLAYPDADILFYGLPHVPLAFWAGQQLEKYKLDFFELNRPPKTGYWHLSGNYARGLRLLIEGIPVDRIFSRGEAVIRISITREVMPETLANIVDSPIASIHMHLENPQQDAVKSQTQIETYATQFREALDQLHDRLPNMGRIHIFYSGPVSLAVSLGQQISGRMDRPMLVYNYDGRQEPAYPWSLLINARTSQPTIILTADDKVAGN